MSSTCRLLLSAAALALATVGSPAMASANGVVETWVAIHGELPADSPAGLVLEIGDSAWLGTAGLATTFESGPLAVRLVDGNTCQVYASFIAPAGRSAWVISLGDDGSVEVHDRTGRPMDLGPTLPPRPPSGCPDEGATRPPGALREEPPFDWMSLVIVALIAVLGVIIVLVASALRTERP